MKTYFVYIMTNSRHTVFYTGVTSNLSQRIDRHKTGYYAHSFTKMYNIDKLVYTEEHKYILDAIGREKVLKKWKRKWKIDLINKHNPNWIDLVDLIK